MNPPRLPRRFLATLLPPADRDVILGDIDEEFRERARTSRALAATWYWTQLATAVPFALRRRVTPWLAEVPADVRYTWRTWRRNPAFAAAAIATQGIGIAVTTAILAVAYAVLLQPLPYRDAGRLVQIFEGTSPPGLFSWADFIEMRRANRSFESVAGFSGGSRTFSSPGTAPERVPIAEVTDEFFEVLGVAPLSGRTIQPTDVQRGAAPVVVMSHGAWRGRFGGAPGILGQTVLLSGTPHTVVGILPADFEFPLRGQAEFWLPLRPSPQQEERGFWHWIDVIGRLRSDASPTHVGGDLQSLASSYAARDPKSHSSTTLRTVPLREVIVGGVRPTIQALLAGVALVMLATCATMAGLLLSRAGARSRELSLRAAVGAGRGRLVRQLLTENVLLALAGGLVGVLAGRWLLQLFVASVPAGQRAALPHFQDVGLEMPTLAALLALTVITGLVFGVVPALRTAGRDARESLKGARTTGSRRDRNTRFVLVALQVGVAFALLSGATLLGTSVFRLLQKSPGFDPGGLVTMRLTLSGSRYAEDAPVAAFHERLIDRLRAIPAVQGVALVSQAPLTGRGDTGTPTVVGRPPAPATVSMDASIRTVSSNYFETLGIALVRGHAFSGRETPTTPGVVMVNQLLAEKLLPNSDPVGERLSFAFAPGPWEIIGVVGNEQLDDPDKPMLPVIYFTSGQDPLRSFTIVARTGQPADLPNAARAAVNELDPALPLFAVRTIDQITANSSAVFMRRAAMWLLVVFAVAALALAAVALYGVLAQSVADRTREIGVRMALGAGRPDVLALIARSGSVALLAGVALGIAVTFLVGRLLRSLLYGISSSDPWVLVGCTLVLIVVGILACAVPLARAVRINPANAMRIE